MYSDLLADENTASKIYRSNTLLKTWTNLNFKFLKKNLSTEISDIFFSQS